MQLGERLHGELHPKTAAALVALYAGLTAW